MIILLILIGFFVWIVWEVFKPLSTSGSIPASRSDSGQRIMTMKCPKCQLENPANALRCDCGFDFISCSGEIKISYLPEDKKEPGKAIGKLYHPINKYPVDIYEGFSWPCLFFGFFWYLYKGMFLWAIISFGAALFTFGISWLVFPFFANKQHIDYLKKQGYLSKEQPT